MPQSSFPLGQIVATPAALDALARAGISPAAYLDRHATGGFGEVPASDAQANRRDIADGGGRIMSAYDLSGGIRIWVITQLAGEETYTTLLLPDEY